MTAAIDLNHLERYVCGDRALLDEILTIYEEQAVKWIDALDPLMDDEEWRDAAHALKGASRGVGSWALGDLCEEAESYVAGMPEKTAKRRSCLAKIVECAQASIAEARRLRDQAAA